MTYNKSMSQQKYEIVMDYINDRIKDGTYKPGDQIPTEGELCTLTGFSRMTVNKAIIQLVNQGVIERTRGRGSFVKAHTIHKQVTGYSSFSQDMISLGMVPGSHLLSYAVSKAENYPEIREKLQLHDNELVHFFVRLRTGDQMPMAISRTWIPVSVVPAIPTDVLNHSLYDYLHSEIKITPKRISYQFSASMPDESIKKQLHLTSATAILTCAHVSWCIKDGKEIPFEYVETDYNANTYTYSFEYYTHQ